jgi:hypothetical protein
MKSVLVSAWLRVAAWAGFHRRTHPAFSGQALSMVGVSCKGQGAWQFMRPGWAAFAAEKFFTFP